MNACMQYFMLGPMNAHAWAFAAASGGRAHGRWSMCARQRLQPKLSGAAMTRAAWHATGVHDRRMDRQVRDAEERVHAHTHEHPPHQASATRTCMHHRWGFCG